MQQSFGCQKDVRRTGQKQKQREPGRNTNRGGQSIHASTWVFQGVGGGRMVSRTSFIYRYMNASNSKSRVWNPQRSRRCLIELPVQPNIIAVWRYRKWDPWGRGGRGKSEIQGRRGWERHVFDNRMYCGEQLTEQDVVWTIDWTKCMYVYSVDNWLNRM